MKIECDEESRGSTQRPSREHIATLDGLRGIAILLVLGIHFAYSGAIPEPPPRYLSLSHVLVFGWMGVDLFFVLSGFLITGILLDTRASSNYFRSFYARRTLRIFPLYYMVVLAGICLTPFASRHISLLPYIPSYGLWMASLFYVQNWWLAMHHMGTVVIGDYWSLGIEEQFYLLWPLVVLKLDRKNLSRLCLVTCSAAPLFRLFLLRHDPTSPFVFMSTLTRMDTLMWGALAAIAIRTPGVIEKIRIFLAPISIGCVAAMLIIDFPLHELYSRARITQSIGYSIISIGFTAFLLQGYCVNGTRLWLARFLSAKLLRSFGRYSYGIYVFHAILLTAMVLVAEKRPWFGHSIIWAAILFLGFFAMSYGVAFVSFHLYESRFLALKSKFKA